MATRPMTIGPVLTLLLLGAITPRAILLLALILEGVAAHPIPHSPPPPVYGLGDAIHQATAQLGYKIGAFAAHTPQMWEIVVCQIAIAVLAVLLFGVVEEERVLRVCRACCDRLECEAAKGRVVEVK